MTKENFEGYITLTFIFLHILSVLITLTDYFWKYALFIFTLRALDRLTDTMN